MHFRTVKKCLHDVFGQRHKISALQRAKALRSALVLWYVKVGETSIVTKRQSWGKEVDSRMEIMWPESLM